jgi:alpha-glucosidase (family GH31 glycosyl hydrolase)
VRIRCVRLLSPTAKCGLTAITLQGLAVTLNLHPADGVGPHETAYRDVCQSLGKQPGGQVIPFDVTDIHYMHAYFKYLHHPLEKQGVSFWWIDWQQGDRSKIRGLDPMFWLNHLHCVDIEKRGKRSLILSRWAGLGGHRYQIGFSGDTYSNWDSLQFQIKMTVRPACIACVPVFGSLSTYEFGQATAGNVCYPYWSHDIGGHFPGAVDPEVFVRWIQWAVFNPVRVCLLQACLGHQVASVCVCFQFLRTHSTRSELAERRIWGYPAEYFSAARAAFHLRYSLIPYIYTTARQCYDTALPLNRPLYYDWPEFEEAYNFETTYMFGPSLLCCPVASAIDTTTGVATVHMWFPPGRWYHLFTGQRCCWHPEAFSLPVCNPSCCMTESMALALLLCPQAWIVFPCLSKAVLCSLKPQR